MVQEVIQDAPVSNEPVAAPESAPSQSDAVEAPPDTQEEISPPAFPESYDDLDAYIEAKDDWKAAHQEKLDSRYKEGQAEGQRRTQPLYERAAKKANEYAASASQAAQIMTALYDTVQKAQEDGSLSDNILGRAVATYAPQYAEVMAGLTHEKGVFDGVMEVAIELAGNDKLKGEFQSRLNTAQLTGADREERVMIIRDLFDAAVAEREKKADDKGYRRGLKEASTAPARAGEVKNAAGAGPDTARGGGSPGMTYDKLMALPIDEYAKVPEDTKRRLFDENARTRR